MRAQSTPKRGLEREGWACEHGVLLREGWKERAGHVSTEYS